MDADVALFLFDIRVTLVLLCSTEPRYAVVVQSQLIHPYLRKLSDAPTVSSFLCCMLGAGQIKGGVHLFGCRFQIFLRNCLLHL